MVNGYGSIVMVVQRLQYIDKWENGSQYTVYRIQATIYDFAPKIFIFKMIWFRFLWVWCVCVSGTVVKIIIWHVLCTQNICFHIRYMYKYIKPNHFDTCLTFIYVNIIENEKNNKFTMSLHIVLKWFWIWCGWSMLSNTYMGELYQKPLFKLSCSLNANQCARILEKEVKRVREREREKKKYHESNFKLNYSANCEITEELSLNQTFRK